MLCWLAAARSQQALQEQVKSATAAASNLQQLAAQVDHQSTSFKSQVQHLAQLAAMLA